MSAWHRFFLGAGWLLAAFGARAELLDEISREAARHPVVRAEFVQTKQMAAMKRPLITRGKMTLARGQGVLWEIGQPYRMTYVLGENRLVEIDETGTQRVREARDMPGLAQVGRIFQAMLDTRPDALREYFDPVARGDAEHWEIELKPRQAQMAQFLVGLRLFGGRFVDEIQIDEAGGDKTRIVFSHSQGAETPTEFEAQRFSGKLP